MEYFTRVSSNKGKINISKYIVQMGLELKSDCILPHNSLNRLPFPINSLPSFANSNKFNIMTVLRELLFAEKAYF